MSRTELSAQPLYRRIATVTVREYTQFRAVRYLNWLKFDYFMKSSPVTCHRVNLKVVETAQGNFQAV